MVAACAVDVKDGVNGQAHIGLTIPFAGFRGGDQAFDMLPFSVGQSARAPREILDAFCKIRIRLCSILKTRQIEDTPKTTQCA